MFEPVINAKEPGTWQGTMIDAPKLHPWHWGLWCLGWRFHGSFPFFKREQVYLGGRRLCSQWVEAITSSMNYARVVTKFFKRVIFPKFGIPRVFLISDRGTHLIERKFRAMLTKYRGTSQEAVRVWTPNEWPSGNLKYRNSSHLEDHGGPIKERLVENALWRSMGPTALPTRFQLGPHPLDFMCIKPCRLPMQLEHKAYWAIN